jgi:UDP-glucose 4-epimerase
MKKALITGGTGFIGGHLAHQLLTDGWEVTAVDRAPIKKGDLLNNIDNKKFHFMNCDVSDNEEFIEVSKNIDQVFHLAANSDVSVSDPHTDIRDTFMTTVSVLDAMTANRIRKLFFASTSAVYGDKRNVTISEEEKDLRPISYYGASKLASEAMIHSYSHMNGIDALILRVANVVGPRMTHGVIFDFVNKLKRDQTKLEILGDGKQRKHYIHVSDMMSAVSMLSYDISDGVKIFNLSAGSSTTVDEIAAIVCDAMGLKDVRFEYTGGESGWKGDVPSFEFDISKIKRTGWKCRYSSTEAVRETLKNLDIECLRI